MRANNWKRYLYKAIMKNKIEKHCFKGYKFKNLIKEHQDSRSSSLESKELSIYIYVGVFFFKVSQTSVYFSHTPSPHYS